MSLTVKIHKKTRTLHPIELKLVRVLTAYFSDPVPTTTKPRRLFRQADMFLQRTPSQQHTLTY